MSSEVQLRQGLPPGRALRRHSVLIAVVAAGQLLRAQAFVGGAPFAYTLQTLPRCSPSLAPPATAAPVSPLFWHPGAEDQEEREAAADDYLDESTYHKKWRKRRLDELLQHPELHPGLVNELLEPDHLERQRHVLAPNEVSLCCSALVQLKGVVIV
jgi:hypothetical protein